MLFVGPPDLGKTTLAQTAARELQVNFRSTSGPVIAKAGDLAAQLTNPEPRDGLPIDGIHRLKPAVEEILYPAMEDFQLDLIIGAETAARSVKIDLAPFTLIGATTRAGLTTNPLSDRFGIPIRLNFYTTEAAGHRRPRGCRATGLDLADEGANEIARRPRGTPRIARPLPEEPAISLSSRGRERHPRARRPRAQTARSRRNRPRPDGSARSGNDRDQVNGTPVGGSKPSPRRSRDPRRIEDIIEPYLIQLGSVQRTPRGRLLTSHAFRHLGLAEPRREGAQPTSSRRRTRRRHEGARGTRHRLSREALASEQGASANTIDAHRRDLADYEAHLLAKGTDTLKADASNVRGYIVARGARKLSAASLAARRLSAIRQFHKLLYAEG